MTEDTRDEPLGWFDPHGAATLRSAWEDSLALVAATIGPEHILVFQNAASRELFGNRPLNVPMTQAFPEVGADAFESFERVRTTGESLAVGPHAVGIRDVNGQEVVLSYVLSPLGPRLPADGVVLRALDVTAEARAEQAAQRTRLLADVSSAVASAVDTAAGLQTFTDSLVPVLADFAAVYVGSDTEDLGDGSEPVPPLVMSLGPAVAEIGPPPPAVRRDEPSPWQEVLAAGQALIILVNDETFPAIAPDPAAAAWLRAVQVNSFAVIPLVVAGQLTGALLLAVAGDRPAYTDADLPFLTDITARAGAAMTQQYTQRRQRDIAARLQRALLPPEPSRLPGLAVAARYVAGAPDVEVGGDWWHVQDLGDGRVALAIGDVSGRGIAAAAVMGKARAAMGAAAHARLAPTDVLMVLDAQLAELTIPDLVRESAPPRFATACYGVVEPAMDCLRVANAGHIPLLLRTRDGDVKTIELPPGAPLGVLVGGFTQVDVPFRPGDTVLLATDGLVESREVDLDTGVANLADALRKYGDHPDPNVVIKQVLDAMSAQPGYGSDDVALLLARRELPDS